VLAILGSIPWVGSLLAASAALHAEQEQGHVNRLIFQWVEEHEHQYRRLTETVEQILRRLEEIGAPAEERLQDEQFLGLVRRAFRIWDEASSDEKREHVRRTVTNAAATRLCDDDLVRLFLQWIEQYDEVHIRVIRAIYREPGSTRAQLWDDLHGEPVREDSAEADLFRLIIRDLSTGGVVRQHRETTSDGRFVAQRRGGRRGRASPVLASSFDDDKPYVLTALGERFVHYVLDEPSPQLAEASTTDGPKQGD
jgi:hypothetical protein